MNALTNNPVLGHITTFGGHPVSCAAGKAALEFLVKGNFINIVKEKEVILQEQLQHKKIRAVRTGGLWAAVEFDSFETNHAVIQKCIANGVITGWFLFAANCLRVAPPLTITNEELITLCAVIKQSIDEVLN